MAVAERVRTASGEHKGLRREVGFIGLIWASEGSIIGSGWLFGAQGALGTAGPAAIISWGIGGAAILILVVLAWSPVGGVSGWGWVLVTLGFLRDIGHLAGSAYTGRARYA
ncbi:MAG: hypothetical protein QOD68_1389 [Actinomycetota bacterium]|jgi:amino acid permease|nr:hypothetical protein [Actinomycetota bacterium]